MANSSPVKAAQAFATLSRGKLPTAEKCVKERVPVFALLQPPNDICKIGANDFNHETLQASSTGELTVQPTICQFSITVSSTKERVQDVKNSVTRRLNYVLQTLHNKHIKDSELNVTESLCRVIGADNVEQFCLESQVSVTVHDVSLFHSVSNHLVEKLDKHVTVSSPQFSHEPAALEQARRQVSLIAVKNCKHKAFELVQAVGAKLGAVLAVKEDYCHEEQLQTADNTAVSRGIQRRLQDATLHITAKVTVTFELRSSHKHKELK